ncbi:phosphoglycerate dehydrogenase [Cysteiniphilum sp. JM-1]|uniref:phosphoglycerate dehydrogenase n=1 Tax=Cysteiniphilum sp. JM-1 TaxID=2610891 RepID=UPI0012477F4C|nr:phosphoglycerate dehydrogenase [Cysteiniphilum sp. JM-1]
MNEQTTSLDRSAIKVLLLEGVHAQAYNAFVQAGYSNVTSLTHALDDDALIEALQSVKIVGVRSRTQLTETVLKACPHLIAIGCFCIGTNQVNLTTAQSLGIPVFNAPFSNTRSVAELVIGQMILLYRNVVDKNMQMHRQNWIKSASGAHEVRGKTLGIIGYGHIGSQVSVLAESLGLRVIFHDIENKLPLGNATASVNLATLLDEADIVTLHVPDTPATKNMITAKELKLMKKGSVLINASRGSVVDIHALAQAIKTKHLKGAAIDVFPKEPSSNGELFESELIGLDNVFLTPHIGGSTLEAQQNIAVEVADKLIKYSDNGSTISAVNFPELSLPTQDNVHRILHIHENKPGMMRAINRVFFDHNINVEGQFLRTLANIGYVVIDINSSEETSRALLQKLKAIDGTIRSRVLF